MTLILRLLTYLFCYRVPTLAEAAEMARWARIEELSR